MRLLHTLFTFLLWCMGSFAFAQGNGSSSLDEPFQGATDIRSLANIIYQWGITLVVLAATIYITFGAYAYFLAAGNASTAAKGKDLIYRSIIGLVIALISWVLLNTISSQFTELPPPSLPAG